MGETSIREVLSNLSQAENDDVSFIVAAAINLYSTAQQRLNGRIMMGVSDVHKLFQMIDLLVSQPLKEPAMDPARPRKLNKEEEQAVLESLEVDINPKTVRRV